VASPLSARTHDLAERRAWYLYDWANSAFVTVVVTVFAGPFLTSLAQAAAGAGGVVRPLGLRVAPAAWYPYLVSLSALLQVVCMPVVGAVADHSGRRRRLLALTALTGSAATVAMVALGGDAYLAGGVLFLVATVAYGCAIVVYNAWLPDIAGPDERDGVSSKGWALGYLGGGLALAGTLVLFQLAERGLLPFGEGVAVRLSLAAAGLWWGGFTLVSLRRLRDRPPGAGAAPDPGGGGAARRAAAVGSGFGQLAHTLAGLRLARMTLLFIAAYLLYNDGIQTVISQSSVFAVEELRLPTSSVIVAVLVVQFVAMAGAYAAGLLAAALGAKRVVLGTLVVWIVILAWAYVLPAGSSVTFLVLAVMIGLVLGGSQALTRSLYSQMIPHGREAEYFSFYEIADRGTSWLGSLLFGLALQFTGSYRVAILSLLLFFVLGFVLLVLTRVRRAIAEAGNPQPPKV
jgi:UMF1 family MFS transporter